MSERAQRPGRVGPTAFTVSGSGMPILFVHGVGLPSAVWEPQVAPLRGRARAVTYDTLGHGASDHPPAGAGIAAYVAQAKALLNALAIEKAVVVGHSMGAAIATGLAVTHPERVAGLLALNGVYRRSAEARAAVLARADALDRGGPAATAAGAIGRWFGPEVDVATDPRAVQLERWLLAADPVGYARAYRAFATGDEFSAGRLHRIRCPAVYATGELDPNSTPAMSHAMASETPDGAAIVLAGERHMMGFATPERVNPILDELLDRVAVAT